MLIQSKWSIVLNNNITLLNIGDYLAAEPKIPRAVENAISRPLRSPAAIPLRSTHAQYTLELERIQVFATDDDAWEALLLWLNNLPTGPRWAARSPPPAAWPSFSPTALCSPGRPRKPKAQTENELHAHLFPDRLPRAPQNRRGQLYRHRSRQPHQRINIFTRRREGAK